ncbi:MAG: hypothetical protein ACRD1B_07450 [Thermoanaerobaculia bacterium]
MGSKGSSLGPGRVLLQGGLVVAVLDAIDAFVFFGLYLKGVTPTRIFQSIAGGLLGRAAFRGGLATALLGLVLHFFNATVIVCVYYFASRKVVALTRHPVLCGLLYGPLVHLFMYFVVVPLSAAGRSPNTVPVLLNGLLGHALLVGLPSALFARAASAAASSSVSP